MNDKTATSSTITTSIDKNKLMDESGAVDDTPIFWVDAIGIGN